MYKKRVLVLVVLLLATGAYLAINRYKNHPQKTTPEAYLNALSLYRHERAEYFRYAPESPFVVKKVDFNYLDYYPGNLNYIIHAKFVKQLPPDTLQLATSTGSLETFLIVGYAHFNLADKAQQLAVLQAANSNETALFIPFLDFFL